MTIYRIGEVDFNPGASEITVGGRTTHLQPQVARVLECLARHQGEVVSRDLLIAEAWKGRCTSDESVTRCISLLRAHFADRDNRHLIETIPKMGYRLTGRVERVTCAPSVVSASSHALPHRDSNDRKAVNLLLTVLVVVLLLSGMIVSADFFTLRR